MNEETNCGISWQWNIILFEEEIRKQVSKAFVKFMAEKFGPDYVAKRSEYLRIIKDLKVKKAKEDADFIIEQAEKEYKENLFDVL